MVLVSFFIDAKTNIIFFRVIFVTHFLVRG